VADQYSKRAVAIIEALEEILPMAEDSVQQAAADILDDSCKNVSSDRAINGFRLRSCGPTERRSRVCEACTVDDS